MPRIIDLTLPLTPGQRGVAMEPKFTVAHDGWNAATWHLYSHAGSLLGPGGEVLQTVRFEVRGAGVKTAAVKPAG